MGFDFTLKGFFTDFFEFGLLSFLFSVFVVSKKKIEEKGGREEVEGSRRRNNGCLGGLLF